MNPLVSIVCLCYNHGRFVRQAVTSVIRQTYSPLQIIVVDDASQDESIAEINVLKQEFPFLEILLLPVNTGNCKAFNSGYKLVRGEFVVDFATDDVMVTDRIEKQVRYFQRLDDSYGVVFTDALYIDSDNVVFRRHFDYLAAKKLVTRIPSGDVYRDVISRYFIPSPTMLSRRKVFDDLKGYDEDLAYEDFDFWVRSARNFKYAFLNEALTLIRRKHSSLSSGWYRRGDAQLHSTYLVCRKAIQLNRSPEDDRALLKRIRYELRQSVFSENLQEARLFFELLKEIVKPGLTDRFIFTLSILRLPLSPLRQLYHKIRFGS